MQPWGTFGLESSSQKAELSEIVKAISSTTPLTFFPSIRVFIFQTSFLYFIWQLHKPRSMLHLHRILGFCV